MASGFSTAYSNAQLNHIFRGTAVPTWPTATWVACFTAANASSFLQINDATSAQEVTTVSTSYARVPIMAATGIDFNSASGGIISQDADIVFAPATAGWGTVYAVALMTALTGGDVVCYGDLDVERDVNVPDVFRVPLGQFIVGL